MDNSDQIKNLSSLKQNESPESPLVSIIVPVYNVRSYVGRCIRSLMRQTYANIEIIVIDDGSTDGSGDIVKQLATSDKRIHYYSQDNQGVCVSRNRGIRISRGEFITFVDGDDFVGKQYINDFVTCALIHKADVVKCGYTMVKRTVSGYERLKTVIPAPYVRFLHEEGAIRISSTLSGFYRKSLLEHYGVLFDTADRMVRGEDIPFCLFYTTMCEKIQTIQSASYYYVQHRKSAMSSFRGLKKWKLPYVSLDRAISQIKAHGGPINGRTFYEWYILRILASFVDLTRGAGRQAALQLNNYIQKLVIQDFPDTTTNPLTKLSSDVHVPFFQKLSVWALVTLYRFHLLKPFLLFWCTVLRP